jgi:integrase
LDDAAGGSLLLVAAEHLHPFSIGQVHEDRAGPQYVEQSVRIEEALRQCLLIANHAQGRTDRRVVIRPDMPPGIEVFRRRGDGPELRRLATCADDCEVGIEQLGLAFTQAGVGVAGLTVGDLDALEEFQGVSLRTGDRIQAATRRPSRPPSGEPLSKATLRHTLAALKGFFEWLSGQSGFRQRVTYSDASYFNLSLKDGTVAGAAREDRVPTLEQIHFVLNSMPHETEVDRRNRALVALAALTAPRADALASMRLRHIDLGAGCISQDARQVRTKYSKTFPTFFVPIGGSALFIVEDWVSYLQRDRLWGPDDPLFPATQVVLDSRGQFAAVGIDRKGWRNAAAVRKIFRDAFEAAALPYSNPHTFRKTLARFGQETCRTPEEYKAFSQNIGHEDVLTTFTSYGEVSRDKEAEIIRSLGSLAPDSNDDSTLVGELMELISRHKGSWLNSSGQRISAHDLECPYQSCDIRSAAALHRR